MTPEVRQICVHRDLSESFPGMSLESLESAGLQASLDDLNWLTQLVAEELCRPIVNVEHCERKKLEAILEAEFEGLLEHSRDCMEWVMPTAAQIWRSQQQVCPMCCRHVHDKERDAHIVRDFSLMFPACIVSCPTFAGDVSTYD